MPHRGKERARGGNGERENGIDGDVSHTVDGGVVRKKKKKKKKINKAEKRRKQEQRTKLPRV